MERQRNMSGDAGDVDNRAGALLLHDGNHCLHGFQGAKEICVEDFAAFGHAHAGEGGEDSASGIVYPNVDALKVMKGEAYGAVEFFAMANVAGERYGFLRPADSGARSLGARRVAREQHNTCSVVDEELCNSLADAH